MNTFKPKFKGVWIIAFMLLAFLFNGILYSQDIKNYKTSNQKDLSYLNQRFPLKIHNQNNPLTCTPENNFSEQATEIQKQINALKQHEAPHANGQKILELQKKLEEINGSTVTKTSSEPFCKIVPIAEGETDNLTTNNIFNGDYVSAMPTQVEQRGTGSPPTILPVLMHRHMEIIWFLTELSGAYIAEILNQDGIIDVDDVTIVHNDTLNFVFGMNLLTDLNGDQFVDISDVLLAYNNVVNIVTVISPP